MKNLYRLSAALLTVGMLGAAACSSCSPTPEGSSKKPASQQSYRCGPNTQLVGNQCVGVTGSNTGTSQTRVLQTTGNN